MREGAWISLEVWQETIGSLDPPTQNELVDEAEAEWRAARAALEAEPRPLEGTHQRYWFHRLIGGAASLGAVRLQRLTEQIRAEAAAGAPIDYPRLDEALANTLAELRALSRLPPGAPPASAPRPAPGAR
jgi:hypothetical protein